MRLNRNPAAQILYDITPQNRLLTAELLSQVSTTVDVRFSMSGDRRDDRGVLFDLRWEMSQEKQAEQHEKGIDIPLDRINPDTLLNMVKEFVSREWADLQDSGCTLDDKIGQVMQQLRDNKAKVVYDLTTETWNIVACR